MTRTVRTDDSVSQTLHGWLPIGVVAKHLGMNRDTVYHAVVAAAKLKQDWVKQGTSGGRRKWSVNTDSEVFRYHERRWKHLLEKSRERRHLLEELREDRKSVLRDIPPVPDFPFGIDDEDDNPLAQTPVQIQDMEGTNEREDAPPPFDWQVPFTVQYNPWLDRLHSGAPRVLRVREARRSPRPREIAEVGLLVLLHLVTIACLVKRFPVHGKSH